MSSMCPYHQRQILLEAAHAAAHGLRPAPRFIVISERNDQEWDEDEDYEEDDESYFVEDAYTDDPLGCGDFESGTDTTSCSL